MLSFSWRLAHVAKIASSQGALKTIVKQIEFLELKIVYT